MAYTTETIEGVILTKLQTITVANGYESAVGANCFRQPNKPFEDQIDPDLLPSLWLLNGDWTLDDEKCLIMWEYRPHIFGVMAAEQTTPSSKYISLAMDTAKLVLLNRQWAGTVIDTKISRITKDPEFTRPYAAFNMEIALKFETGPTAP